MKIKLLILVLFSIIQSSYCQKTEVKWYTIQEAEKLIRESPRPMIVDTFTDWCTWCKKLDTATFSNPIIAEMLNNKFYPVKFDAEGKDSCRFQGTTFINDGKSGKAHQLAVAMLRGQMAYPNIVFFNEKIQLLTNVPGYRTAKEMEVLLRFFADKIYEKKSFQDFEKSFVGRVK
jgi:thioredoxin-related protein